MSAIPSIVSRSIAEACAAAPKLVDRCIDHAVSEMQAAEMRASPSERQVLTEAWRELLQSRRQWSAAFPGLLRAECEATAIGAPAESQPMPLRMSSLTLVDDQEIARQIQTRRLAERLASALERPLAELDALMSTALELPGITPERNPLRPEVFTKCWGKLIAESASEQSTTFWLRHFSAPMAEELQKLYKDQKDLLTGARVQAANYRVVGNADRPRTDFGALAANSAPAPLDSGYQPLRPRGASAFAELADAPLDGPMLQEFLARGVQAAAPLTQSFYQRAQAEVAALEAIQETAVYDERAARQFMHMPAVERPVRHVGVESPLPQQVWGALSTPRARSLVIGRLKTRARELGQVLGLEVVRKLVDQVARDPRLLAPVREAIVALEPSLLRLAMVAPRFFSEEDHPGRRLLESVAERSFRYNDEFSVEFQAFFGPVSHTFNGLNAIETFEDDQPFRAALAQLVAGWAAQDQLDEEKQKHAFAAVHFAERRQEQAVQIARELAQRSDLQGTPDVVHEFLLGPWALVMAHARLSDTKREIDPGGYVAVVADLLWSIKPDQALRDPAKAFVVIPRVLVTLRKGLAILGQPPEESEPFFTALEVLHRPVLKLRAKMRQQAGLEGVKPPPAKLEVAREPRPESDRPSVWMADRELHVVGFQDAARPAPRAAGVRNTEAGRLDDGEVDRVLAGLVEGNWVDLYSRDQWRRARLKWASQRASLFMFVSDGGMPHSMTRRSLEKLVRERLLRPVDSDAVVPRAIETLAREPSRRSLAAA